MHNPILSQLIQEFTINDVTFYVRGMSVSEVLHLNIRTAAAGMMGQSDFLTIGQGCTVGWRGLRYYQNEELFEVEFSTDAVRLLPVHVLQRIGEFAYSSLTVLTDVEADQLRGYIRFSTWLSDEKNKAQEKTYDCMTCIRDGHYTRRVCGLANKQALIDQIHGRPDEPEPEAPRKKTEKEIMSPYTVYRMRPVEKKKALPVPAAPVAPEKIIVKIPGVNFSFPECPVSWVPVPLKMTANLLYSAGKANMPFYPGGVGDQPYKMHSAQQVVLGESARIESEKMDEDRRKSGIKSKKR